MQTHTASQHSWSHPNVSQLQSLTYLRDKVIQLRHSATQRADAFQTGAGSHSLPSVGTALSAQTQSWIGQEITRVY